MTMEVMDVLRRLRWIDGTPLKGHVEPYRARLFTEFFDERDERGRPRYNLGLFGRAKKNWKTADAMLAGLYAMLTASRGGSQVLHVANDQDQARDGLDLLKLLLKANPALGEVLEVKRNVIERRDGAGFIEVLPAQDVAGSHGKTYRLLTIDEVHAYRSWDLLEALALDPTRPEAQQWITSYASIYHRPGVPLFDLYSIGRAGTDPRMLFSWYAADYCTDPGLEDAEPAERANPSMGSWEDDGYLEQQRRRLPSHKFRRLHLNLPGLPEGSAFQPEPVMDAVDRGVARRRYEPGHAYRAFVDMSGGSNDDAVLAVGHAEGGRYVVDRLVDQGPAPPFDPRAAVERFAKVLAEYRLKKVVGDAYAGQTFRRDFQRHGVEYRVADRTASQLYEDLEPRLNAREVSLPDVPELEQQLLGLIWRGSKITHPGGEHDDFACACAGVVSVLADAGAYEEQAFLYGDEYDAEEAAEVRSELERLRAQQEASYHR